MNMFANMTRDVGEESGDRLGPGGTLESGIYDGTVKLAYVAKAQASQAQSVNVHIDLDGHEFRERLWITGKEGNNYYLDKKDPTKKKLLMGFEAVDDLCLLTTGHGLAEQTVEEKVVALYDFEAKRDVPQNVPVLTDLIGKPISVAVLKQIVDKNQKVGNEYVPTGETREENVSDKFFHAESRRTVSEFKAGIEEPIFYGKWLEKNQGKTRNRAKGAEGKAGAPGRPTGGAPGAAATKPKTSLFGS